MPSRHASHGAELVPDSQISELDRLGVELRQPDVLRSVVRQNSELEALLVDVVRELRAGFGDRGRIAIEPFIDPELPGAQPRVYVLAVTRLSFEQADAILDHILDGWWAHNQSRANYLVSLATEFE